MNYQLVQVPNHIGSITVVKGGMFSGKSGTLVSQANQIWFRGIPVIVFAPDMSRREASEKEKIQSRDGVVALCESAYLPVNSLYDVCMSCSPDVVICIDEAQFFADLMKTCIDLRKRGTTVIVAGLTLTSNRTPFGELHALLDRADAIIECRTVCHFCKQFGATLSFRTCSNKEEICVGGKNEYVPACQLCFDERFEKK